MRRPCFAYYVDSATNREYLTMLTFTVIAVALKSCSDLCPMFNNWVVIVVVRNGCWIWFVLVAYVARFGRSLSTKPCNKGNT